MEFSDSPSQEFFGTPGLGHIPANQGHPNWLLGLYDATPNATVLTALSFGAGDGSPFPDPRYPIPMNIDPGQMFLLRTDSTDRSGMSTFKLALPLNPVVAGLQFYVQFFIEDAGAVATGGVYGSQGVAVEIL